MDYAVSDETMTTLICDYQQVSEGLATSTNAVKGDLRTNMPCFVCGCLVFPEIVFGYKVNKVSVNDGRREVEQQYSCLGDSSFEKNLTSR